MCVCVFIVHLKTESPKKIFRSRQSHKSELPSLFFVLFCFFLPSLAFTFSEMRLFLSLSMLTCALTLRSHKCGDQSAASLSPASLMVATHLVFVFSSCCIIPDSPRSRQNEGLAYVLLCHSKFVAKVHSSCKLAPPKPLKHTLTYMHKCTRTHSQLSNVNSERSTESVCERERQSETDFIERDDCLRYHC